MTQLAAEFNRGFLRRAIIVTTRNAEIAKEKTRKDKITTKNGRARRLKKGDQPTASQRQDNILYILKSAMLTQRREGAKKELVAINREWTRINANIFLGFLDSRSLVFVSGSFPAGFAALREIRFLWRKNFWPVYLQPTALT